MAQPNTYWLFNSSVNDGANIGNATGGTGDASSEWVVMDLTLDALTFCSEQQMEGDLISGPRYPLIIPSSGSNEAEKTFVKDASTGFYAQVPLAGTTAGGQNGGDTRYVFAIYFDNTTAGIPYLEAWDDNTHLTSVHNLLGDGTSTNSSLKGITTTNALPGSATWAGTGLAGDSAKLSLDTGALTVAKNLYFNIKQLITQGTHDPATTTDLVLTLRYLYA